MKRERIFTIILFIISVAVSSVISVSASSYLYDSCDVKYDNTNSGLNSTNVQSSLDELYMHATDYTELKNYFQNNPTSYFNGNRLLMGGNNENTSFSYIDFYSDKKQVAEIGIDNNNKLWIGSYGTNSSGNYAYGSGGVEINGNPVMINGKEISYKIKYKEVTISNITIPSTGYYSISNYFPSGMNNFLFAIIYNYGSISTVVNDCEITGNGKYIFGEPGSKIENLVVRYFYTD